jgi:hypothetical protein
MDVFDDIVERVLPKYSKEDVSSINQFRHHLDINKILRALTSDSEAGKKKVIQKAKQTPFLKAVDAVGCLASKKPCDVYQDRPNLRLYFSGSTDVWFLHEKQLASDDSSVLSELGIESKPRFKKLHVDLSWDDKSRLIGNQGHTRDIESIDYDLDGLDNFLLQFPGDYHGATSYSLVLWEFLLMHLKESSPFSFYEGKYSWFRYQNKSASFPATWKKRLLDYPWLPKAGTNTLHRPEEISSEELPDQFEHNERLANLLGFKKNNVQKLAKEAGVKAETIELARALEKHPDLLKSVLDQIQEKKGIDFSVQKAANPDRRKEKVREDLKESPGKRYEPRTRSVRVSESSDSVRSWLKNQYTNKDGKIVCQICKQEMPFKKRDGEYYFEAVEALSKDHFLKEHEAQFLALCPLCAAMYKELVKKDQSAMTDLRKALLNVDSYEAPLRLGDLETTIQFVETHLIDIKTVLEETGKSEGDL